MVEAEVQELKMENKAQNETLKHMDGQINNLYNIVDNVKEKVHSGFDELKDMIFGIEKGFEEQKNRFEQTKNCSINELKERSEESFASKLVEKIVYGMVGFILMSVIGALIGLILIK